jgi:hypothetical protein
MKRFAAMAMAVAMTALSAGAVLAARYDEVTLPADTVLNLKEELTVKGEGTMNPAVTYTLTLGAMQVYSETTGEGNNAVTVTYGDADFVDDESTIVGTLATVEYTAGEIVSTSSDPGASKEKAYVLADGFLAKLKAIKFTAPGIYYWPITKTSSSSVEKLTNYNMDSSDNTGSALVVRVNDVNGVLTPTVSVNEYVGSELKTSIKNDTYKDQYPVESGKLKLTKTVSGNQGATDQYFKFDVKIENLGDISGAELNVIVTNGNSVKDVTETKYEDETFAANFENPTKLTVTNGVAEGVFWLKADEYIEIENILEGAHYTITESANSGYTVTATIAGDPKDNKTGEEWDATNNVINTEDATDIALSGNKVEDTYFQATKGADVTFNNEKNTDTPTGIFLAAGPGLTTVILAGIGLAVVGISRRKRNEA